jgi:hypothetical protein
MAIEAVAGPPAEPPSPGRWTATSVIPANCTDTELAHGLGYSLTKFYRLKGQGAFAFLELKPPVAGTNTQYSGHLITKWLRGELEAGKARSFFMTARRESMRGRGRR